jgi:hypothetical protein
MIRKKPVRKSKAKLQSRQQKPTGKFFRFEVQGSNVSRKTVCIRALTQAHANLAIGVACDKANLTWQPL